MTQGQEEGRLGPSPKERKRFEEDKMVGTDLQMDSSRLNPYPSSPMSGRRSLFYVLLPLTLGILACGGGGGGNSPAPGPTTGSLQVNITGLPSGALAQVSVTGPSSYSQSLSASQTLSQLNPGTYTVSALNVSASERFYVPSPTSQTATVTAGQSATASIAYSQQPISVSVTPASASLIPGGTQTFSATVTGSSNQSVTWSASGGSITSAGLYSAPATPGNYQVTATSILGAFTGSATVTVASTEGLRISPSSVRIAPGTSLTLLATYGGLPATGLTWSIIQGQDLGSVSPTGLFTAGSKVGTCTVQATHSVSSNTATALVTIASQVSLEFVGWFEDGGSLSSDETALYYATVQPEGINRQVKWRLLEGEGIGQFIPISYYWGFRPSGNPGTFTVEASAVADPTAKSSRKVQIVVPPTGPSFTALPTAVDTSRSFATTTILSNGKVLWLGGQIEFEDWTGVGQILNTASILDPVTLKLDPLSAGMQQARTGHQTVALDGGTALTCGGAIDWNQGTASAELFDASTQQFSPTASLTSIRAHHRAIRLSSGPHNGKVLVLGGTDGPAPYNTTTHASAEIYDPIAKTFTPLPTGMKEARASFALTRLLDGRILITGGYFRSPQSASHLASAEIFDPVTLTFSSTAPMLHARSSHTATLFTTGPLSGKVLVVGGYAHFGGNAWASAELFDPVTGTFTQISGTALSRGRAEHGALLLPNGKVLISGGGGNTVVTRSVELFDPATQTFSYGGRMLQPRVRHGQVLLPDGRVVILGGEVFQGEEAPKPTLELSPAF